MAGLVGLTVLAALAVLAGLAVFAGLAGLAGFAACSGVPRARILDTVDVFLSFLEPWPVAPITKHPRARKPGIAFFI